VESLPDGAEFINKIGMRFVRIRPGHFDMGFEGIPLPEAITMDAISAKLRYTDHGNRDNGDFDEHPAHRVRITKPFHMGTCRVTNAQYEQFDAGHRQYRGRRVHGYRDTYASELAGTQSDGAAHPEGDDEAVVYVSWHDAVGFCRWLSEKEGLPYRLPTEAEWEYACRAGTDTPYSTGNSPPPGCVEKMGAEDQEDDISTLKVGEGEPNQWGLYDMHGNVEEWCHDWYGPYEPGEQVDPVGRLDGDFKVTRGGSHSTELYFLRSANRMGTIPEDKHWLIGLRVVIGSLPGTTPLPSPSPQLWQRDVSQQKPPDLGIGPDPDRPYFSGPREYVKIPEDSQGPLFSRHNHDPALVKCPNGDLLAVWYTCVREPGRELGLAASRLRWGRTEWDPAAPFWDAPDRNDHAPALGFDGNDTLFHFNGLSVGAGYRSNLALVMRTSKDNGVTWSKARFVNAERGVPSQPVPSFIRTREGQIMFVSDAPRFQRGRGSILWISEDEGKSWRASEGSIEGIHAGVVQLKDGCLMALGRCAGANERMPMSISSDLGRTWEYSLSPLPPIRSGQRIVLMRLREGPILLCSFAGARRDPVPMTIMDASGKERLVTGLFAAISLDEGRTWPHIRLVSDDGPGREVEAMDGNPFTMGFSSAEPLGYLSACQADNGVIHLISSRQHYSFNLAWLSTPAPSEPRDP
jgi:formylglycine-generating enzyme required for sulfatase activity